MSDITNAERDDATGRFVIGTKPGPGRPLGSRNVLSTQFLADLRDTWETHGAEALRRCATEEPGQFCRIVAGLLPRDLNINLGVDAGSFAATFRAAVSALGNEPPPVKVINGRRR